MKKKAHSGGGYFVGAIPAVQSMLTKSLYPHNQWQLGNPYIEVEETCYMGDDIDVHPYKRLAAAVVKQAIRALFTPKYREECRIFLMDPDNAYLAGLGIQPLTIDQITAFIKARSIKGALKKAAQQATADAMNGVRA